MITINASSQKTFLYRAISYFMMICMFAASAEANPNPGDTPPSKKQSMKTIYLAGGCFWGVEKYFSLIPGVTGTEVGYANGNTENPSYEQVCRDGTGHAEAVKVDYLPNIVSLPFLLEQYYKVIDPVAVNRQGNDIGVQYRTGIYYTEPEDKPLIEASLATLQKKLGKPLAIELAPLKQFYKAEEHHQDYLDKNPAGYCHISPAKFKQAEKAVDTSASVAYRKKSQEELKKLLTKEQFEVTQNNGTERPFENAYFDNKKEGVYVDITTGEPLFISTDKFDSGCGWPSFSKPINSDLIENKKDLSHGMSRIEVRSKTGDAHLGHVFNDGPTEKGGLRYCINSASLRFIPRENMQKEGYGNYLHLLPQAPKN